jgi:hypothetical protein
MKLDKNQWISFENVYENINYELDSVKFNKVLAFDILMTVYNEDLIKSFSYFSIIKNFFKTIYLDKVINSFKKNSLLATNKTKRADYNELFEAVLKDINDFSYLELSDQKNIFKFNLKSIFISIKKCKHLLKLGYGFKNTIYISSKLCFYLSVYKDLIMFIKNKNSFSLKAYLAFNSAISLENLITQFFNQETNVNTFSLSHGVLFGRYKKDIPLDYINGFNNVSTKIIVWGEYSKQDLITNFKVKDSDIIISGNPKYTNKPSTVKKSFTSCLVILPRDIYHESNVELLYLLKSLSKELNFEVSIKLHPSLIYFNEYNDIAKQCNFKLIENSITLKDCLLSDKHDFSVGYNTNAYYESLYFDMPFFRYEKPENEIFRGLNDKFSNEQELSNKIEEFKNKDQDFLNAETQKVLISSLGLGINNYSKILN